MTSLLNISHGPEYIIEYVDNRKAPNNAFEQLKNCFESCVYEKLTVDEAYTKIFDMFNHMKRSGLRGLENVVIKKGLHTSYYNDINSIYLHYGNENMICEFNQYGRPKNKEEEDE